jgi:hypothetical protein
MSVYINPNGEYPRYAGDIQEVDPSWSEDQPLPTGWHVVEQVEQPVVQPNIYVYEDHPVLVSGSYRQHWVAVELTTDAVETLEDKVAKYKAAGLDDETIEVLSRKPSSF